MAYAPAFPTGIFVAAGNVLGGPAAQIITSADTGGRAPRAGVDRGGHRDQLLRLRAGVHRRRADRGGERGRCRKHRDPDGAGPGRGPHVGLFTGAGTPVSGGFFAY